MVKKKIRVLHFLDSLGSGKFACDRIEKESKENLFEHSDFYSYKEFKDRNDLIPLNEIGTLAILDDEENKNVPTGSFDIQISIPPCKGLSLLGLHPTKKYGVMGSYNPSNDWMYQTITNFLKHKNKILIMENAFALSGNAGLPILDKISKMIGDEYKMNVIKINLKNFGVPSMRKRVMVFIYKSDRFLDLDVKHFFRESPNIYEYLEGFKYKNQEEVNYSFRKHFDGVMKDKKIRSRLKYNTRTIMDELAVLYKERKSFLTPYPFVEREVKRFIKLNGHVMNHFPRFPKKILNALAGKRGASYYMVKYERYMTFGELHQLMGLKQGFKLRLKDFRIMFRTCPSHMLKPFIEIAISCLRKDKKLYNITNEKVGKYLVQEFHR